MGDAELMLLMRVQALQSRYARCLDNDELEHWPGFFTQDCTYKVTSADNHQRGFPVGLIYADSRDALSDRVKSLREANIYEGQSYRHVLSMPVLLTTHADGSIETETSFMVVRVVRGGQGMLFASGRYLDRIDVAGSLRDGGGMPSLFRQKIVVCDSSETDTLLALPL